MKHRTLLLLWLSVFLIISIPGVKAAANDSIQIVSLWKQSMGLTNAETSKRDALLNKAISIAQQSKQYSLIIKLYHWKAVLSREVFNYEKAIPFIDSALQVAVTNHQLQTEACRNAISFCIITRGEFTGDTSILKWIVQGKILNRMAADWMNYTICLVLEAIVERDTYTVPQVLALYDSARYYAAKTATLQDDIMATYNQSYFLKMQGSKDWVASLNMLLSMKQYFNAIEWLQPPPEPWERILFRFRDPKPATYRQIAASFVMLLDFDNAFQYQKKVVEERRAEHDLKKLFFAYAELGEYAILLANKQMVQSIYDTCVLLAKQIQFSTAIYSPSFYVLEGWLKEMNGEINNAIKLYRRSCSLEGADFKWSEFYLLRCFVKQHQYTSADSLIRVLYRQQQSSFVYFPQALFNKVLSYYYKQRNKPDSATLYLLKYYQLKDSLLEAAHYIQLKEIDTKYQTEEKDRLLAAAAELKALQTMQLNEAKKINHLMLAMVFALIIIVILIGYVWQQKRKQAYVLTQKNNRIELLIRELHHRIKNNLQIVAGILSLHANRLQNSTAKEALEEGKARVNAIALLHQRLYMDDDVANVNMQEYIQNLSVSLANSFGYSQTHVHTIVQLKEPMMTIDKAIPIGLIINELVTNAFKHAFKNIQEPLVTIEFNIVQNNILQIKVADNGIGIPNAINIQNNISFGMRMVHTLVKQLDAELFHSSLNGTLFIIEIKNI